MMKKTLAAFGVILLLFAGYKMYLRLTSNPKELLSVILVDGYSEPSGAVEVEGFKSILQEEGIRFRVMTASKLMSLEPERVGARVLSIIFPDTATRKMPKLVAWWARRYVNAGGWVFASYDSATRDLRNNYHFRSLWDRLSGVDYFDYQHLKEKTATLGKIRLTDAAAIKMLEWPVGKRDPEGFITGYMYGRLTYPMSVARLINKNVRVLMSGVTREGKKVPILTVLRGKRGGFMLSNIPIGAIKVNSDDLPARNILRAFLFHLVRVPHIVSSPGAVGGMVINWHVDWSEELDNLMWFFDMGFFRTDLQYSMHVTAGPYRDTPGDGLGFNAGGLKGMLVLNMLSQYGEVGSHGGWGHNWFADNIEKKRFHEKEIQHFMAINSEAIEEAIGYHIEEYAAPNGVHPQPAATRALANLGMDAYYYPGDSGSVANRTFYGGRMVEPEVVAFPVMPFGKIASLYEAFKYSISEQEVQDWLTGFEDRLADNRVVRLWYSHPYDVPLFPNALKAFLDHAEALQKLGRLRVMPMSYFARFLLRMVKVRQSYVPKPGGMQVNLYHRDGLREICVALPRIRFQPPDRGISSSDEDYYYVCTQGNPQEDSFFVPKR